MPLYYHVPYARIFSYVFTILFHSWLLIRSFITNEYLLALLLGIPVVAVSIALLKFMNRLVIKVQLADLEVVVSTCWRTERYSLADVRVLNNEIVTDGRTRYLSSKVKAKQLAANLPVSKE